MYPRKVHADNICFFVGDVIQESRILVGKSLWSCCHTLEVRIKFKDAIGCLQES